MIAINTNAHLFFWYTARSSGVIVWALSFLSVCSGLLLSTRLLGKNPTAPWTLDLHRFFGGLAVLFVALHIGSLVADTYVYFGWSQVLVPFASKWKPLPVAWGVVGFYLLLAIELSSLIKPYISKKIWRSIHYSSFALYIFSTVHFLTAGTDARNKVAIWSIEASVAVVTLLTTYRFVMPRRGSATKERAEMLAEVRTGELTHQE